MGIQFTFELVVTLTKFGEKPIIFSKRTLDVYMSTIHQVVFGMVKSYLDEGWNVYRIEMVNFEYYKEEQNGLHVRGSDYHGEGW